MSFRVERVNERVVLTITGPLAIEDVSELRDEFLQCGAPGLAVTINAGQSGIVDLSIVQLLAAIRLSCPEFRIDSASDEFLMSLERCAVRRAFHSALARDPGI